MSVDTTVKLLDVVALLEPLPEKGLERGQVGTVVEEWRPGEYEVEFSDENGVAQTFAAVHAEQLLVLRHDYAASAI